MSSRTRAGKEVPIEVDADHEGLCVLDPKSVLRSKIFSFIENAFKEARSDTWGEDTFGMPASLFLRWFIVRLTVQKKP